MKLSLFKKIYFCSLLAGFAFFLTACIFFDSPEDTITVTGTVIITRRGIPWNPEHIHYTKTKDVQNVNTIDASRTSYRPPPNYQAIYINKNLAMDDSDLAQGKYTWEIEIPVSYIPGPLYLTFVVPMANFDASKTIEVWAEDENSVVDSGTVDFDVIRLWGNLPVTFNGEPLSYSGTDSRYQNSILKIITKDGHVIGSNYDIEFDANWEQDVYALDSETPLRFTYETCHRGGFFNKLLNPNHEITVYNTDKEIIFPDYPNLDFEAFSLKGTVDIFIPHSISNGRYINFSFLFSKNINEDGKQFLSYLERKTSCENENVTLKWETWVPAFSFPTTLLFEIDDLYSIGRAVNSSIIITEETDLQNIYLGSFSIERYY